VPTTRNMPEPKPTRSERYEELARVVIAGHPQGSIRRIALYLCLFTAIGACAVTPLAVIPASVFAALLVATDQLL
jgi:hypothetical protein